MQRRNRALPTSPNFNPTIVQKLLKGHIWQRKSNNLLTKWEPRPHWKILPHKKIISSPHRPIPLSKTSTTAVSKNSQQRSDINTIQQAKPHYLVPLDFLQPSSYSMDKNNKCRVFLHLAGPHQQAHHKTLTPISQYCPGSHLTTIQEHPFHQDNWVPYPATHPLFKKKNAFVYFQPTNAIYSDQTGVFPIISSRGYRYIMFVYIYDINAILLLCLKNKAYEEHLHTFKDFHTLLLHRGLQPKYCRMDNECSAPI